MCNRSNVNCDHGDKGLCLSCYTTERNVSPMVEHIQKLEKRINDIENVVTELVAKITGIANYCYRERLEPHKCPVCGGCGKDKYILLSMPEKYSSCHACHGNGVLWK